MTIDWLSEIEGGEYGYVAPTDTTDAGSLVRRDPQGDTSIDGVRVTILDEVTSREDALDAARSWAAAR